MKVNEMKLTVKQKAFADEYIISTNATASAIKAGYSEKTAAVIGAENLRKPNIRAYIDKRLSKMESERIAKGEEVMEYLTAVMRGESTEQALAGIGEGAQKVIDMEVPSNQRIRAAELIGKRHGLWTDRIDLTATVGVKVIDDVECEGEDS